MIVVVKLQSNHFYFFNSTKNCAENLTKFADDPCLVGNLDT